MANLSAELSRDLSDLAFFQGLDPGLQNVLVCLGRRLTTPKRDWVSSSSGVGPLNVLLLGGRAKLGMTLPCGDRVLLGFATRGDTFPPLHMPEDLRNCFTALAVEDCTAIAWAHQSLIPILDKHPRLLGEMVRHQSHLAADILRRLLDRAVKRTPMRTARTILHLATRFGDRVSNGIVVPFPVSLRDLAEFAGTTRFTVCRLLSTWRRAGVVEFQENRLSVLNLHKLERLAGVE